MISLFNGSGLYCGGKINGEIPFISGNTYISRKIREAFPVIFTSFANRIQYI
jgi:hypothetical protein